MKSTVIFIKKMSILFTLLSLFAFTANAQWQSVSTNGLPYGGDTRTITNGDGKLFVKVNGGDLFMSTDDGANWTSIQGSLPSGDINDMLVNNQVLYVAVNGSGLWKTSTTSISWSQMTGGLDVPSGLYSMAMVQDTLFVGTNDKHVFYTDVNNVNWNRSQDVIDKDVLAFTTNGTRLFAGTNKPDQVFEYDFGGKTWIQYNINLGGKKVRSLAIQDTILFIGSEDNVTTFNINTYQQSRQLKGWETEVDKVLSLAIDDTTIIAGTTKATWAATINLPDTLEWKQITSGQYSSNTIVRSLTVKGTDTWAAIDNTGPFVTSDNQTWAFKATGLDYVGINNIIEDSSKLYALTNLGLYESPSGNGGDWALYGLEGKNVGSVLFSSGGNVFAQAGGILYKKNGANFDIVNYATDTVNPLGPDITKLGNLFEVIDSSGSQDTAYIYVGSWEGGIDGYAGIYRSSDEGVTWDRYDSVTSIEDTSATNHAVGLHDNGRIVASNFASSSDGKVYVTGKNVIQITDDYGDNWYWRRGNYDIPWWGTSRGLVTRFYEGTEYLFYGTEDYWYCGRTETGDSVAMVWERADGDNTNTRIARNACLESHSEYLLFSWGRSSDEIYKTEDNGNFWRDFTTGLPSGISTNNINSTGNYMYLAANPKSIYRYDMTAIPAWNTLPDSVNTSYEGTEITYNADQPGDFYVVVLDSGAAAPSAEQVIAGTDTGGQAAIFVDTVWNSVWNQDTSLIINGLNENTSYEVFCVYKNEVRNTTSVEKISIQTKERIIPTLSFSPDSGSTGISIDTTIIISFSHAVRNTNGSEITNTNVNSLITFKETNASGADVSFNATINSTKDTISITPDNPLSSLQLYYIEISSVESYTGGETNPAVMTFETVLIDNISENSKTNKIKIYPNPSKGDIFIENARGIIKVINILGEIMIEKKAVNNIEVIDMDGNTGVFFIKTNDEITRVIVQ